MNSKTLILIALSFTLHAKEISLSFDDAPRGDGLRFSGLERTKRIIKQLKESGVERAAFYVNTKGLSKKHGLERVKLYKQNGHLIGNHTHSHINIRKNSQADYLLDFDKADKLLREHKLLSPYFRYPYLRRGKNISEVKDIHSHIKSKGYTDAYVTIDNYDFYMEDLYQRALKNNKKIDLSRLKKFYINTLYEGISFYDQLANKALKKNVKHVMLLHENDLAALFLSDLIKHLKNKGWKIISPEQSYSDETLKHFPSDILNHGSGRIVSIAKSLKYSGRLDSGLENTKVLDKLFHEYKVIK